MQEAKIEQGFEEVIEDEILVQGTKIDSIKRRPACC
jgi:hypothetical protein